MSAKKGFTLVEALVAIVLILVLIVFVFTIFTAIRKGMSLSENHINAAILGRSILNEVYSIGAYNLDNLKDGTSKGTYSTYGYNNGNPFVMIFDYQIDVVTDSIYNDKKNVCVTVKWKESQKGVSEDQYKQIILETIFTDTKIK